MAPCVVKRQDGNIETTFRVDSGTVEIEGVLTISQVEIGMYNPKSEIPINAVADAMIEARGGDPEAEEPERFDEHTGGYR